jgi:hypothetical protein
MDHQLRKEIIPGLKIEEMFCLSMFLLKIKVKSSYIVVTFLLYGALSETRECTDPYMW